MAGDCAVRISDTRIGEKVIVLLHGYLESLDVWEDFAKLLAKEARVIAIDLPGHGISEIKGDVHTMEFLADVTHDALKAIGIEKALIVGHSMGGYVALEFIRKYPESATGIVLFHSGANADSDEKKENRMREVKLIEGGKKELIARSFPHVGFAPQNRKRFAAEIEDLAEQIIMTEDEGIIVILKGLAQRRDLNGMLRESNVPQLILLGRHDEYIKPEMAEAMVKEHPQAKVVWLEESGHMGFIEQPTESSGAILDFLRELA